MIVFGKFHCKNKFNSCFYELCEKKLLYIFKEVLSYLSLLLVISLGRGIFIAVLYWFGFWYKIKVKIPLSFKIIDILVFCSRSIYIFCSSISTCLWDLLYSYLVWCFSYGLLGPSGCGKTTLLRCLLGRARLDAGEIVMKTKLLKHVGYMPQVLTFNPMRS